MKEFEFSFSTKIDFDWPVEEHRFVLRCVPALNEKYQKISDLKVTFEPKAQFAQQTDGFGNTLVAGSVDEPHTVFAFEVTGKAAVDLSLREPAVPHPMYRYASSLTKPNEAMRLFLARNNMDTGEMTFERCLELSHLVFEYLTYAKDVTTVSTTAAQAFDLKAGVCQDYAHVLIALLRILEVPCRYVMGLVQGEGATHAWVEVNVDGMWYGIDPTHDCAAGETYLRLAVGRDYNDCAVERGTFRGFANQTQQVSASLTEA